VSVLRRVLVVAIAAASLLVGACTDEQPTAPSSSLGLAVPPVHLAQVIDGSVAGGNPRFFFLPPTVQASPATTGTFDGTLLEQLRVEICRLEGNSCSGDAVASLTSRGTQYYERIRLNRRRQHYLVYWDTGLNGKAGSSYRIQVLVGDRPLGTLTLPMVNVGETGGVEIGSWLPIAFRVEEGATTVAPPPLPTSELLRHRGLGCLSGVPPFSGASGGANESDRGVD
jgi:hypothetical protein